MREDDTRNQRARGQESKNPRIQEERTRIRESENPRERQEDENAGGRQKDEKVGGRECKRMTRRCTGVSKMAMSR